MQTTKEATHTLALRHVSICGESPSYSYPSLLPMPLVKCWCMHIPTSPGKAKWSGPHQREWEENIFKLHSVTSYINSIVSRFHVNTTKLCNLMCTLVGTGVILRSLECIEQNNQNWWYWISYLVFTNDRGEPAISCKWTGWVWEITSWS